MRSRPLRARRLQQLRQAVATAPAAAQAAASQAAHAVQAARAAVVHPHDPTAPLRREWIDDAVPILRWIGGVVLIGYSSVSTVVGVNGDLSPVTQLLADPNVLIGGLAIPLTLLIAVLVAAGLQVLQFVLPERSPAGYGLSLAFDAWYTRRQSSLWIVAVLGTALTVSPLTAEIVLWGIAIGMGTKLVREMLRSSGRDYALHAGIIAGAIYGILVGMVFKLPDDHGVRVASRWLVLEAIQWIIAIAVAYFGEVLLLGRRRRPTP